MSNDARVTTRLDRRNDSVCADVGTAVDRFIKEKHLLNAGDRVLVALSGGADSVALLYILISLKEDYNLTIYAAHFHHGIRGAEADRDENFVRELCAAWDIPLYLERADVPATAAASGESMELCGRRLRYRFLEKIARDLGGAKIATAHHCSDNAETVLWNLTRGAGIGGLCGIPVRRGDIIRPLLCLTRDRIDDYCRENNLRFVTDSTNLSDDYTRNRLRHQVMPVLRELNARAEENIAHTSELMTEAHAYLRNISDKELNNAKTAFGYSCDKLLSLDPIVLKYAVKQVIEDAGAPADHRHIALIIGAMRGRGAVNLTGGYTAECAQGVLRIRNISAENAEDFCVPLSEYIQTHGVRIAVRGGKPDFSGCELPESVKSREKVHNLLLNNCIPCAIISRDTVVRRRRAGDTFTDARRGVTKTLKKLMNELKIPREKRDTVLVAADGSTVLWLSGYGVSAQAKPDLTRDGELIWMGEQSCIKTWKKS